MGVNLFQYKTLFNTKVQRYRVFMISLCLCISVFTKIVPLPLKDALRDP